jgi:hypothetical protein
MHGQTGIFWANLTPFSAQISDDSKTLVVRYTNSDPAPERATVALAGVAAPPTATS